MTSSDLSNDSSFAITRRLHLETYYYYVIHGLTNSIVFAITPLQIGLLLSLYLSRSFDITLGCHTLMAHTDVIL